MLAPAIAERARKSGLEVIQVEGRFEARKAGKVLAFNADPTKAVKKAEERLEADRLKNLRDDTEPVLRLAPPPPPAPVVLLSAAVLPETPAAPAADRQIKGSIIKSKYKDRYKKNGYCCGDEVATELREYLVELVQGRTRVNVERLRQVALDNGIDFGKYANLNVGQQRMNVGNRLRHKFAEGDKIDIGGAVFQMEFD